MKARVTRYPNNEIRVAVFPERLPVDYFKVVPEAPSESQNDSPSDPNHTPVEGSDSLYSSASEAFNIKSKVDTEPRKPRLSLSKYGRATILRAGSCFSKSEDSERLLLTGTLPGSLKAAFRAIALFSTSITKKLTNWLTRHEPGCKWLYCWEFQGRGALHLHLVCEVGSATSVFVKKHFKDEWNRLIKYVGDTASVDMYAKTATYSHDPSKTQADVTVCDREPSRYVSKYVSKNTTHAHGFSRFPPRQWYQVSRSLLRELRERTEKYEVSGLSYRGARQFIENGVHHIQNLACAGQRLFSGSVLAWSGYGYSELFNPLDWHKNMNTKQRSFISTEAMAKNVRNCLKNYPATQCHMRSAMHKETLTLMEEGMLSETELLLYIETGMRSLAATWEGMRSKSQAAILLRSAINWWEGKYGYCSYTPEFRNEINKICEDFLTR